MERDVISALGQELGEELEAVRDARNKGGAGVARARAAFVSGSPSRYRRARKLAPRAYAAGATLLAAAAIVLVAWIHSLHTAPTVSADAPPVLAPLVPLTFTVSREAPGGAGSTGTGSNGTGALLVATTELPLAFSDGTKLLLEREARARVTDVDHLGARVILESGTLHASVVHTGNARWNVDAGPFEVHVTGTKFVVAWDPGKQAIDVTLEEGSVVVSGCAPSPAHTVRGGEAIHLECGATSTSTSTSTPTSTSTSTSTATTTSTATATPTSTAKAEVPVEDLFVQADEARYAGRLEQAKAALLAVRRRAPGTEKSASAAFELGRLAFDGKGDYPQAAIWFDTYLRERPQGTLVREALGRSMEAQDRAGDAELAQRAAATYLERYPSGPHAALARRLAGARAGTRAGTRTGDSP